MIYQVELLEEILSRLPAKSIGRFRCVSKSWNSLLSHPDFIRTHLNRINQYPIQEQSLILVKHEDKCLYSVNLKSAQLVFDKMTEPLLTTQVNFGLHKFKSEEISDKLTSCDGLIVVEDIKFNVVLINPIRRDINKLPPTPNYRRLPGWDTVYGIGYDSSTDDYKVVTISYCYKKNKVYNGRQYKDEYDDVRVNVYSVKNRTWKSLNDDNSTPFDHSGHCAGGVYFNGHIHWIAQDRSNGRNVIAAFDLKEEVFWELPAPKSIVDYDFTSAHFVIIQGCLGLATPWWEREYEYFVMEEYNVEYSWTRLTIINHDKVGIRPLCLLGKEQMVLLRNNVQMVLLRNLHGVSQRLVVYNMKQRVYKHVEIQDFPEELVIIGTFVESLLSPHYLY